MFELVSRWMEKIVEKVYRFTKCAWLRIRFGGRAEVRGVNFRKPFYCRVGPQGNISIGGGSFVNYDAKIISFESIRIGKNCLIGPNVGIYDFDHSHELDGRPFNAQGMVTAPITIGDNVWIGANAVILKGSHIGSDTVIASGAVVSGNVSQGSFVYEKRALTTKVKQCG